jgi:hypothetical protein
MRSRKLPKRHWLKGGGQATEPRRTPRSIFFSFISTFDFPDLFTFLTLSLRMECLRLPSRQRKPPSAEALPPKGAADPPSFVAGAKGASGDRYCKG